MVLKHCRVGHVGKHTGGPEKKEFVSSAHVHTWGYPQALKEGAFWWDVRAWLGQARPEDGYGEAGCWAPRQQSCAWLAGCCLKLCQDSAQVVEPQHRLVGFCAKSSPTLPTPLSFQSLSSHAKMQLSYTKRLLSWLLCNFARVHHKASFLGEQEGTITACEGGQSPNIFCESCIVPREIS